MDRLKRPDWDSYFIALAFLSSTRSLDPSTKHGSVITDKSHRILSIGYNGPPRGMRDPDVPLTRPDKYSFMAHAEENAILNCNSSMEGATVYVTGYPCHKCFRMLIQKGVSKIVYGPTNSKMVGDDEKKIVRRMLRTMLNPVKLVQYKGNPTQLFAGVIERWYVITSPPSESLSRPEKTRRAKKKAGEKSGAGER